MKHFIICLILSFAFINTAYAAEFIGIVYELHNFCEKCRLSRRTATHIDLFFEELIFNTMLTKMQSGEIINVELESAQGGENVSAFVTANTDGVIVKDILDEMDDISRNLIIQSTKSISVEDGRITAEF